MSHEIRSQLPMASTASFDALSRRGPAPSNVAEGEAPDEANDEGDKPSSAEVSKSKAKIKACGTKLKDLAKLGADLIASQVPLGCSI